MAQHWLGARHPGSTTPKSLSVVVEVSQAAASDASRRSHLMGGRIFVESSGFRKSV
jgi:hypothetical protein